MKTNNPVTGISTVKQLQRLVYILIVLHYSLLTQSIATENYTSILVENGMAKLAISVERQHSTEELVKNITEEVGFANRFRPPKKKHELKEKGNRFHPVKVWTQISVKYYQKRANIILAEPLDRFTLNCSAPYLTRWTSNITPLLPAKYGHANRYQHDPFQLQGSNITFESQISFMLPNGTSGYVQCESVTNASVATKVHIYTQDGFPLTSVNPHYIYEPPIITDTRKNFIVPCRANYPDVPVYLVNVLNFKSGKMENVNEAQLVRPYDPQEGFHVRGNGKLEQRLRCKVVNVTSKRKARPLTLTYNVYNPYLNPNGRAQTVQFFIGSQGDEFPLGIWCKTQNVSNQIRMIACNSQYECDWLNDCFYVPCIGTQILHKKSAESTRTIEVPFPRGKVICEPTGPFGVIAYEYFFTGLDRHRYWLKANAYKIPKQAVIRISETEPVLYSNQPAKFACETSNFVLFANIRFATIFKNGTKLLLEEINTMNETSFPIITDNNLGFSRKEIAVNVTTNIVGIMCMAPWLNSSEWIHTSRTFEVKDVQAPFINSWGSTSHFTYFVNDTSRSLFCNTSGQPQPSIKWTVPVAVEHNFWGNSTGDATLQLPTLNATFTGRYQCTATNKFGSADYVYSVKVEQPNQGLSTQIIIIIVTTFSVLTIGILVSIRNYLRAKRKIKYLTEEEVKDFLLGESKGESKIKGATTKSNLDVRLSDLQKDALLQEEGALTNDEIQLMAFTLVIPSSDLKIMESASAVLGEGEFGKVTRGILKGEPVAVKTTKSCANREYFKALLSEIKVMQYLGKWSHPNVVQFKGAVVDEIKILKAFVVMELSPIGNVESFLRKLGCGFVDLLSDGTVSLCGKIYEQVKKEISTLNLVSWCEQIACAMDFLSSKKVVHIDLAARNVLMFKNDIVKITDFGLSRKLYSSLLYKKTSNLVMLPQPWMAIESLISLEFSPQSDVWSFGVTVWEIFSLCQVPLIGVNDYDSIIKTLQEDKRLRKPSFAPETVYCKLLECWRLKPEERPSFSALQSFFNNTLTSMKYLLEVEDVNESNSPPQEVTLSTADSGYVTYGTEM